MRETFFFFSLYLYWHKIHSASASSSCSQNATKLDIQIQSVYVNRKIGVESCFLRQQIWFSVAEKFGEHTKSKISQITTWKSKCGRSRSRINLISLFLQIYWFFCWKWLHCEKLWIESSLLGIELLYGERHPTARWTNKIITRIRIRLWIRAAGVKNKFSRLINRRRKNKSQPHATHQTRSNIGH